MRKYCKKLCFYAVRDLFDLKKNFWYDILIRTRFCKIWQKFLVQELCRLMWNLIVIRWSYCLIYIFCNKLIFIKHLVLFERMSFPLESWNIWSGCFPEWTKMCPGFTYFIWIYVWSYPEKIRHSAKYEIICDILSWFELYSDVCSLDKPNKKRYMTVPKVLSDF